MGDARDWEGRWLCTDVLGGGALFESSMTWYCGGEHRSMAFEAVRPGVLGTGLGGVESSRSASEAFLFSDGLDGGRCLPR